MEVYEKMGHSAKTGIVNAFSLRLMDAAGIIQGAGHFVADGKGCPIGISREAAQRLDGIVTGVQRLDTI